LKIKTKILDLLNLYLL